MSCHGVRFSRVFFFFFYLYGYSGMCKWNYRKYLLALVAMSSASPQA